MHETVAKLYFRFGAMNSGKSTALLQAVHNYEERGHRVLIAKPSVDTKGDRAVVSRLGFSRNAHFTLAPNSDVFVDFQRHRQQTIAKFGLDVSAFLIDEAQFLSEVQVDNLLRIAILEDIPVLAYGIRTDFQTVAFPGSRRLLEVAHSLEELKTICRCGRKAIFNARKVGNEFVFDGDQVEIDGVDFTHESLCGACYLTESNGVLNNGRRRWHMESASTAAYSSGPDSDFS